MNVIGEEGYNQAALVGRSLPWLQDVSEESVWDRWEAQWRDVYIVDAHNRVQAIFNLFEYDLQVEGNRELLKQLFLAAAKAVDSDKDQLSDDWEQKYFGGLAAKPADDPDRDGTDNFTEFAFGTNPADPKSNTSFQTSLLRNGPQSYLSVAFRRRAGGLVNYTAELSPDFKTWTRSSTELASTAPKILFDGTGTSQASYSLKKPADAQPYSFIRIKALPR